jgi:hypothetical protein
LKKQTNKNRYFRFGLGDLGIEVAKNYTGFSIDGSWKRNGARRIP